MIILVITSFIQISFFCFGVTTQFYPRPSDPATTTCTGPITLSTRVIMLARQGCIVWISCTSASQTDKTLLSMVPWSYRSSQPATTRDYNAFHARSGFREASTQTDRTAEKFPTTETQDIPQSSVPAHPAPRRHAQKLFHSVSMDSTDRYCP